MPRPPKERLIESLPPVDMFIPRGLPPMLMQEVTLTLDEMEAIRLVDLEHLSQAEAAEQMEISAPTLNRIVTVAHEKIAAALWRGAALKIEGGLVRISPPGCGHKRRHGGCPFEQTSDQGQGMHPCPRCHRHGQRLVDQID